MQLSPPQPPAFYLIHYWGDLVDISDIKLPPVTLGTLDTFDTFGTFGCICRYLYTVLFCIHMSNTHAYSTYVIYM
jgi:hypothetical protein